MTNGEDISPSNSIVREPQKRTRSKAGNDAAGGAKLERRMPDAGMGADAEERGDTGRFLVRVTTIRKRVIDDDNVCEKYVVDCCRYAGLIPGDEPGKTKIEATCKKAGKEEAESTLIEIFAL